MCKPFLTLKIYFLEKENKMNPSVKVLAVGVVAMVMLVLAGCKEKQSAAQQSAPKQGVATVTVPGSPYNVEYETTLVDDYTAGLKVTVKGPAARLSVILTEPNGKAHSQVIEKEQMMTNSKDVSLPMADLQEGAYALMVKSINPEKVVWQKNIQFSIGQFGLDDVQFNFVQHTKPMEVGFLGYKLEGVMVTLHKQGDLPVNFTDVSVTVDGKDCSLKSIKWGGVMFEPQHMVNIEVYCPPTRKMEERDKNTGGLPALVAIFKPGEKGLIKGTLFCGKDRKPFYFEKEYVVPPEGAPKNPLFASN
jgi:hypothetical protein